MKKTTTKTAKRPVKQTAKAKKTVRAGSQKRAAVSAATSGLSQAETARIALILRQMKDSVSKTVEEKKKLDLPEPEVGDSIDQASQSLEKEILFELSDSEMAELGDIEAALRKMENGSYGICEHCQCRIEKKRIKAIPSARYCLACQSGAEKQRMR